MSTKTNQVLRLMEEGETDTATIKEKTGASEALISRCRKKYSETQEPEKVEEEEEEENPEVIKVNEAGKEAGTGTVEEVTIKIVEGSEEKPKEETGTIDKIIGFLEKPENQPIVSIIGSMVQQVLSAKVPTQERQEPKWGRDKDGNEIQF